MHLYGILYCTAAGIVNYVYIIIIMHAGDKVNDCVSLSLSVSLILSLDPPQSSLTSSSRCALSVSFRYILLYAYDVNSAHNIIRSSCHAFIYRVIRQPYSSKCYPSSHNIYYIILHIYKNHSIIFICYFSFVLRYSP
jgi:hypothetical protein